MFFFFSSRRRHTRFDCDWSSDVCSSHYKFPPSRNWRVQRELTAPPPCARSPPPRAAPAAPCPLPVAPCSAVHPPPSFGAMSAPFSSNALVRLKPSAASCADKGMIYDVLPSQVPAHLALPRHQL